MMNKTPRLTFSKLASNATRTVILTVALALPLTAHADNRRVTGDTFSIPVSQQGQYNADTPRRGASQQQVVNRYGEPQQRHSTVGQPPITRWDYSGFSVYFEGNIVLHSVLRHQGRG